MNSEAHLSPWEKLAAREVQCFPARRTVWSVARAIFPHLIGLAFFFFGAACVIPLLRG